MKVSINWLKEFVDIKQKPEELASLLSLHTLEVEGVEKIGDDFVLDIDVTPNRGDCLSHIGIAREVAVLTNLLLRNGSKLQAPNNKQISNTKLQKNKKILNIKITDNRLCPRYTALVINNIKITKSPALLQKRLMACGIRPINNIVDMTNYVMLETGQPLHAFDLDKIKSHKILVRPAKAGESVTTLDSKKHKLKAGDLVIADGAGRLIDLAGIMGGKLSEVDNSTKSIILQAATFDAMQISRTSRRLDQHTKAAKIYEYGNDINISKHALARCLEILKKTCPGYSVIQKNDIYSAPEKPLIITMQLEKIHSLIGLKISIKKIKQILKSLGFSVSCDTQKIKVQVPSWRHDIKIPEDIIEEIARIYGYENIPAKIPASTLIPPKHDEQKNYTDKIKQNLVNANFLEVYNYSFNGEKQLKNLGINTENHIELENPISQDAKYMRKSLLPNILKNIHANLKHNKEFKLFEIGKIYKSVKCKTKSEKQQFKTKNYLIKEDIMLTGALISNTSTNDLFYMAKGVVESLCTRLGIMDLWFDDFKAIPNVDKITAHLWQKSYSAEIKINNHEIGYIGIIKPKILENTVIFTIDLEQFIKLASQEREFEEIPKFPPIKRDLALLVNAGTKVDAVLAVIEKAGAPYVYDVDLFDMYEGENLAHGKKSLAFHIMYLARDRTMTDKEVDKIQEKILNALKKKLKAEIRK